MEGPDFIHRFDIGAGAGLIQGVRSVNSRVDPPDSVQFDPDPVQFDVDDGRPVQKPASEGISIGITLGKGPKGRWNEVEYTKPLSPRGVPRRKRGLRRLSEAVDSA